MKLYIKKRFIKQIEEKKSKAIMVNLTKLLLGIWDGDNLKKKYKRLLKEWEPILKKKIKCWGIKLKKNKQEKNKNIVIKRMRTKNELKIK